MKDKKHHRAIIIEAKKSAKESEMESDCRKALSQIDTKKYADAFYGYDQVLRYGVAFFRKRALVRKEDSETFASMCDTDFCLTSCNTSPGQPRRNKGQREGR